MNRFFDIILSLIVLIVSSPLLVLIMIILFIEIRSPLFFQKRVGKHMKTFTLIKFRTMKVNAPSIGTHNISNSYITKTGKFLRKVKLDELPQLINVLKGDMSLVGPRPCLPNQEDVVRERNDQNVFEVRPGITGLSQISDIDMSTPKVLAKTDRLMIDSFNIKTYFHLLFLTALGKGSGDRVK